MQDTSTILTFPPAEKNSRKDVDELPGLITDAEILEEEEVVEVGAAGVVEIGKSSWPPSFVVRISLTYHSGGCGGDGGGGGGGGDGGS